MSRSSLSDLRELAKHMLVAGPRKALPTSRRVRVLFNNTYIVDTSSAVHVWEHDRFPQYYVPLTTLRNCAVDEIEGIKTSAGAVGASLLSLKVLGPSTTIVTDRVIQFSKDEKIAGKLAGLVRLEFGSMDKWLEEDEPIYVHPKDPFKRIDILPSTRPIEIKVAGHTIASSPFSMHLFETTLPTRYYLPLSSVKQEYIRQNDLLTKCPYKGDAEYYDVVVDGQVFKNLVWYYRLPTHESSGIAGMVCFYNEKVDIFLDGVELPGPKTHFA